jgi:hypothetical protein
LAILREARPPADHMTRCGRTIRWCCCGPVCCGCWGRNRLLLCRRRRQFFRRLDDGAAAYQLEQPALVNLLNIEQITGLDDLTGFFEPIGARLADMGNERVLRSPAAAEMIRRRIEPAKRLKPMGFWDTCGVARVLARKSRVVARITRNFAWSGGAVGAIESEMKQHLSGGGLRRAVQRSAQPADDIGGQLLAGGRLLEHAPGGAELFPQFPSRAAR